MNERLNSQCKSGSVLVWCWMIPSGHTHSTSTSLLHHQSFHFLVHGCVEVGVVFEVEREITNLIKQADASRSGVVMVCLAGASDYSRAFRAGWPLQMPMGHSIHAHQRTIRCTQSICLASAAKTNGRRVLTGYKSPGVVPAGSSTPTTTCTACQRTRNGYC